MSTTAQEYDVRPYALAYAAKGLPVVPLWWLQDGRCACGGKPGCKPGKHPYHPAAPNGVHSATTDPSAIQAWPAQCNLGLPTGRHFTVLDIDRADRGDGEQSLAVLEERYGTLPATLTARTRNGGRHLFFKPVPGAAIATDLFRSEGLHHLDLRGEGGYVAVEPSRVAPDLDGGSGCYVFDDWEPLADPLPELAAAPEWLVRAMTKGNQRCDKTTSASAVPPTLTGTASITSAQQAELDAALSFFDWSNYDDWQYNANRLRCLGDVGFQLWLKHSATSPQFDEAEARAKWGQSAGDKTGYTAVFKFAEALGYNQRDRLRHKDGRVYWQGGSTTSSKHRVGEAPEELELQEVGIADLFGVPAKPHPHFIAQILPARVVTLLAGHGGLGKSFLLLLMAAHVAVGRNFAGLITTKARVVVVSLEDDGEILRSRLRAICEVHSIDPAELARNLRVFDASDCGALMSECTMPGGGREVRDTLLMERIAELAQSCDVLMVDNASEALDANENERRMVRAFLRRLKGLVKRQGGALLLLAHIRKAGARERSSEDYSGSTAWNNSVRSRLALTEETDGQIKLEHQKANLGTKAAPIYLSRATNGVPVFRDAPASTLLQCRSLTDDAAVMAAVRDAWEAGRPVTGAKAGIQTTLHVLPEIMPAPIPRTRLRAALIRLEQSGMVETVALRTPSQRKEKPFLKTAECAGDPFAPLAPLAPDTVEVEQQKQATLSAPLAPLQCAGGMGGKSGAQEVEQERQTEGEQP